MLSFRLGLNLNVLRRKRVYRNEKWEGIIGVSLSKSSIVSFIVVFIVLNCRTKKSYDISIVKNV